MPTATFAQRVAAILSAVIGAFGVFCAAYSVALPDVAALAIILFGCVGALNYLSHR
jgi:uncharacterized membrane protein